MTLFLCLDYATVRLDISLMDRSSGKNIFDDDVGFVKASFDVAFVPVHVDENVARRLDRMKQAAIAGYVRMEQGGGALDRLERIEQRFHLLVLDVDQFQRLFG